MKRKIMLSAVAIMAAAGLYAQNNVFSIGPRVGVNLANVSHVNESKTLTGLAVGITSTYSIAEHAGIMVDLLYSQEGYKTSGDQSVRYDYLRLPIYYTFFLGNLGEALRPKVYAGLAPGINLKAETVTIDITKDAAPIVLDMSAGLGLNYRLASKVWLNADLRAFIGLTDFRKKEYRTGDKLAARNIQTSLGVAFGL